MLCTYHRGVVDFLTGAPEASRGLGRSRPCMGDEPFAVVDVEATSGDLLSARVIEVGIVLLDAHGQLEGRFESLVDPGVGFGGNVHGLCPDDVATAPPFSAIADEVAAHLRGRVLVAHEASFDLAMLRGELGRCGHRLDPVAVCTRENLPALGVRARSLVGVCAELGIDHRSPHRALPDAEATAELWCRYLERAHVEGYSLVVPHGGCRA